MSDRDDNQYSAISNEVMLLWCDRKEYVSIIKYLHFCKLATFKRWLVMG